MPENVVTSSRYIRSTFTRAARSLQQLSWLTIPSSLVYPADATVPDTLFFRASTVLWSPLDNFSRFRSERWRSGMVLVTPATISQSRQIAQQYPRNRPQRTMMRQATERPSKSPTNPEFFGYPWPHESPI